MGIFNKIKNIFKSENLDKYDNALSKSRNNLSDALLKLSNKYKAIDNDYFDELEEILITSDVGVNTVMKLVDKLKLRVVKENLENIDLMNEIIVDELFLTYVGNDALDSSISFNESGLNVILVVGVNGVGKTTTIGKLANKFNLEGKNVVLAAGDTFRAGATKQLSLWGEKTGCHVVVGKPNQDPSSVIYDSLDFSLKNNADVLICDTAGRLQNKNNLMQELEKIKKVIGRVVDDEFQETLLVIDATTGQNGINQAKVFSEVTDVNGIILTKLDGTSKGGIVLAIKELVNIPVKYVGLGEGINDIEEFDIEKYIYGLFNNLF
ncbi:MAG: signal recognition particle-docking protein FtsY [Bacilli bacterium]